MNKNVMHAIGIVAFLVGGFIARMNTIDTIETFEKKYLKQLDSPTDN